MLEHTKNIQIKKKSSSTKECKKSSKNFFDQLTDEQKAKAKECKTAEELMDFFDKEGLELPDELLDSVAGGLTEEEFLNLIRVKDPYDDRYR